MKRRELILGGIGSLWAFAALAQQVQAPGRPLRISALIGHAEADPDTRARIAGFRGGDEAIE